MLLKEYMKILVISGFLGAGKTTFIAALSEKTGRHFTVMENEYGGTGIDGDLLQQNRLKVWELTEGCICCSLKSDFASSILTIANTLAPEYLIVEPTGVGLLSAVMRNIEKIEYERIQLLEPLTIVDIHCVDDYIREFGGIYTDQIKNAPRLLLSKIEQTSPAELSRITALLRDLKPHAEILNTPYQNQPDEWWNKLLLQPHSKKNALIPLEKEHEPDLENVGFTGIQLDSVSDLLELLVALIRGFLGAVYRVKGYTAIGGYWTRFDIVDKRYSVALCDPMPKSKVIIIGQHLRRKALASAFNGRPVPYPAAPFSSTRSFTGLWSAYRKDSSSVSTDCTDTFGETIKPSIT